MDRLDIFDDVEIEPPKPSEDPREKELEPDPQVEEEEEGGEEEEEGALPTEKLERPTDPALLKEFMNKAKDDVALKISQIDAAGLDDLKAFAKQMKINLTPRSLAGKKDFLKAAVIEYMAHRTSSSVVDFSDLYTYQTNNGTDYLPLAPNTINKVIGGLDIISNSHKFTGVDLAAYASSRKIPRGSTRLRVEELRKLVLVHYIETLAPDSLTAAQKSRYDPKKLKRHYGVAD